LLLATRGSLFRSFSARRLRYGWGRLGSPFLIVVIGWVKQHDHAVHIFFFL
jgi:hypothetical protein